jgi:hypothetical protein
MNPMEKSNGIKLGVIVGILSLFFCSSLIIQISFAEEIELKSVGRGCFVSRWARNKKCENKFFRVL